MTPVALKLPSRTLALPSACILALLGILAGESLGGLHPVAVLLPATAAIVALLSAPSPASARRRDFTLRSGA